MQAETALDIRVTRVTAPSAEPLTLEQVKTDRVIDHNEHDDLLTSAIQAAREVAESITGRALMPQQWQQLHPCPGSEISLHVWPAINIESVTVDGETIDHAALLASGEMEFLSGDDPALIWPGFRGKRSLIIYTAGYADADSVPAAIKKWLLLHIGSQYEHRESEIIGSQTQRVRYTGSLIAAFTVRRFF
tara:strand:- start:16312 stop:16881 length:570 start_codon:yes stop_codon:yes gene_type:complete